jgi:hypothetical protein
MALPTMTSGFRTRLERRVGTVTCSGWSAARGLRGLMRLSAGAAAGASVGRPEAGAAAGPASGALRSGAAALAASGAVAAGGIDPAICGATSVDRLSGASGRGCASRPAAIRCEEAGGASL